MKIETRDDLALVLSLCDACVRANGLMTSPRVYKLASDIKDELDALGPDMPPAPMTGEEIVEVERKKKGMKTVNERNKDIL